VKKSFLVVVTSPRHIYWFYKIIRWLCDTTEPIWNCAIYKNYFTTLHTPFENILQNWSLILITEWCWEYFLFFGNYSRKLCWLTASNADKLLKQKLQRVSAIKINKWPLKLIVVITYLSSPVPRCLHSCVPSFLTVARHQRGHLRTHLALSLTDGRSK
jgi:hypothetical protein